MSKKSKRTAQDKRRRDKRARKDARQAQWQAYAAEGKNKKSKRAKANSQRAKIRMGRHLDGPCPNDGCLKCNRGLWNDPWLAPKGSVLYGLRWSSSKWRDKEAA